MSGTQDSADSRERIHPCDLSVVVQGPIVPKITRRGLQSLRTHLPAAEIILSSWKGSDVDDLDYDTLILNDDPGPIETQVLKASNLNRLLWSTTQGLEKVSRPFCLKFRTDLELTGSQVLNYFNRFTDYIPGYRVFKERIVISSTVTWSTARIPSGQFHPSDMFGLGRTEDLRRWWSAPLFPFKERSRWDIEPPLLLDTAGGRPINELTSEQYIWLSALNRTRKIFAKKTPSAAEREEDLLLLLNNFVVVDPAKAGIRWLKPMELPFGHDAGLLGLEEYRFLYRKKIKGQRMQLPLLSIWRKRLLLKIIADAPAWVKPLWRLYKRTVEALRARS